MTIMNITNAAAIVVNTLAARRCMLPIGIIHRISACRAAVPYLLMIDTGWRLVFDGMTINW